MDGSQLTPTHVHVWATSTPTDKPVAEEEEYYSSWSLFLVCALLILSLWTSYYLQIKRIRVIHETLVSIFAGMFVGLIVRLAPGNMIREMLVCELPLKPLPSAYLQILDIQTYPLL
jgi:sodium/hydrogen exchanger-like protein 6/7